MTSRENFSALHNAHVWAYFRHHSVDPDESLFIAFDEGSLRAHQEILEFLISDIVHHRPTPPGVREYGLLILAELHEAALKQHAQWTKRKTERKSRAGRPQAPSQGLRNAQVLSALYATLTLTRQIDPAQHAEALGLLQSERQRISAVRTKYPAKRRGRGQPPKHRQRAEYAMDVWAELRRACKAGEQMSEAEAIESVALTGDALAHSGDSTFPLSQVEFEARDNRIHNLCKKIEAAYYLLKPHLPKDESELGERWIPLEKQLDE